MDVKELLKFVDESMFAKTGKRLNDLQRQVIEGALNHQKYVDIADSFEKSEGHVKDTGYELLQMLSDIFEEPVKKGNLKSVLERQRDINFNISDGNNGSIAKIKRLQDLGLTNDEIAELLEIPLESIESLP
jgi:hypothetical protein